MSRSQLGAPAAALTPFPTVEDRVQQSTELWTKDLRQLFEVARERFSDVSWETDIGERVWAHKAFDAECTRANTKAVVYVRAPKAFKDRYFITTAKSITLARSPTSLSGPGPTPTPYLLSASSARDTPSPSLWRGVGSSLSVDTVGSEGTFRAPTLSIAGSTNDGVLRLRHDDAPELFRAQLEWLYTGEGFGDVVEWISGEREGSSTGTSVRDSLGRRGNLADRRDKLGQDLTYMWTSKLYCDVRIHLESPDGDGYGSDSSGASEDSLTSTVIFTAHRFMLVSRSRYFASLLLNEGEFRPSTADVHLPTPPFTPAALHFCLGWMYAGHLDFSNRSYDLITAFQIYRAAEYLQLDCLVAEIESRIVHDFCHGLDYDKCRCRRCLSRVPRVWRFAGSSDVGALELQRRARRFIIPGWGETWGREIGLVDKAEREDLTRDVVSTMTPSSVVGAFRGVAQIRRRIDHWTTSRGKDTSGWVEAVGEMIEPIERRAREFLVSNFAQVCESRELWALFSGKGFSDEVLDTFLREVVDLCGRSPTFVVAPKVYQTIVSALLLKVDPATLETVLPTRSANRHKVEAAKVDVLKHIKKRWMSIQTEGGFLGLESGAVKEISDAIGVSPTDLVAARQPPFPRARENGFPRTTSRAVGLAESSRPRQRTSSAASPETPGNEPSGLRRLRLSSSASISSVTSARSAAERSASALRPAAPSGSGPQARSPTAAEKTPLVTVGVGSKHRSGLRSGHSSPTPSRQGQVMSGPPRPLLTGSGRLSSTVRQREGSGSGSTSTPSSPAISSPLSPTPAPREDPAVPLPPRYQPPSQPDSPTAPLRHQMSLASVRSVASARSTATSRTTATTRSSTKSNASKEPPAAPKMLSTASSSKPAAAVKANNSKTPARNTEGASKPATTSRTRTVSTASRAPAEAARAGPSTSAAAAARSRTLSTTSTRSRALSMASSLAPSVASKAASTSSRVSAASTAPSTSSKASVTTSTPTAARASTGSTAARPGASTAPKPPPVPRVTVPAKTPVKTPVKAPAKTPVKAATPRASTSSIASKPPTLRASASTKSLASRSSVGGTTSRVPPIPKAPTTSTGSKSAATTPSVSRLTAASVTRARATSLNPQATPPSVTRQRTTSSTTPWKRATPLPPSVAGVAGQRQPRQRPSMRSLSGSTEGPPEAVTPRVSEVSEPILVLDEKELDLEPAPPLMPEEEKITPVPPIPAELRNVVKAVDVVVSSPDDEPEEEEGGRDDASAPESESNVPDVHPSSKPVLPGLAVEKAPSDTEIKAEDDSASVAATEDETYSIAVTEATDPSNDAPDSDRDSSVENHRPPTPPAKDVPALPRTPEPHPGPSLNTTPKTSDPLHTLCRDSPTMGERVLKTPTPASPFPPSRSRTPMAAVIHAPPTPAPASLASPPKNHLSTAPSVIARSPRSSIYTASSPISVISRVASESGSLRSLNSGWHPAHAFDPPKKAAPAPLPLLPPPPTEDDENAPYSGPGVSLHVGIPCIVTLSSRRARFRANVKYLGRMKDARGAWVGLEVEDLDRLGVDTLPSGARDGVRYFHFTPPPTDSGSNAERAERARKLALIADEMAREARGEPVRPRPARVASNQLGLGGLGMRAASPFAVPDWGPPERPRALFVRPSEVLFVMGSD